jgi:hypothetical protein
VFCSQTAHSKGLLPLTTLPQAEYSKGLLMQAVEIVQTAGVQGLKRAGGCSHTTATHLSSIYTVIAPAAATHLSLLPQAECKGLLTQAVELPQATARGQLHCQPC